LVVVAVVVVVFADVCEAADGAMLPFCWADMGDSAVPLAFFAMLADLCRRVVMACKRGSERVWRVLLLQWLAPGKLGSEALSARALVF
jgi:hypothetical protein